MDNIHDPNQYISNLTSLSLECHDEKSCEDISLDCNNFDVENCTIGCLENDACERMNLSCSGNNIKQCFIYTLISDSAMSNSLVDCNYDIISRSTHFCGYKCGEEGDGCFDAKCLDHGYQTNCSCKAESKTACGYIKYMHSIITTQFVTTEGSKDDKNWLEKILANTTDDILIFGGMGVGVICLICFILICVCGYRIKNGKIQKVAKEYKVENKTLNSGLLQNDTLAQNGTLGNNNNGKTKNGSNKTSTDKPETAVSYDDNAELGSFKMIPDAELGDGLFNSVVVDDDDDY